MVAVKVRVESKVPEAVVTGEALALEARMIGAATNVRLEAPDIGV